MSKQRILTAAALALSTLAPTVGALAQQRQPARIRVETTTQTQVGDTVVTTRTRTPEGPGSDVIIENVHGQDDTFVFVSSEMSIDGKVVKAAPYSAQAVTEMVQTLGDGNRIVRKNTANVYRDSEGRTRRDQTLGAIGPFAAQGDPPQTVFINDPVAGVHYILDPRTRSARKLPRFEYKIEFDSDEFKSDLKRREKIEKELGEKMKQREGGDERRMQIEKQAAETHSFVFTTPGPMVHGEGPHGPGPNVRFFGGPTSKSQANTEKLPAQTIEGVLAEGTRTTITIPAGEIGNEQPINIVSERWYSPELQTVIMTRHSDPRFGENTYKLTNISRTEPAATLFQIPGDYTVKEAGPLRKMRAPGLPRKPAPGDAQ